MFKKENLKDTFSRLNIRRNQLQEASEWFDGSDGEHEVMAELTFINSAWEAFWSQYGTSPVAYFKLDAVESSNVEISENGVKWFDLKGHDYGTDTVLDSEYGLTLDNKILNCDGCPITEGDRETIAVRNSIEDLGIAE